MTQTIFTATSEYVNEINELPVKRQVSVSGLLKKLGVSRSGYNAWKNRVPSDTEQHREMRNLTRPVLMLYGYPISHIFGLLRDSYI